MTTVRRPDVRFGLLAMGGRDPQEDHRDASPLELLFDLTFAIAFNIAGQQLAHLRSLSICCCRYLLLRVVCWIGAEGWRVDPDSGWLSGRRRCPVGEPFRVRVVGAVEDVLAGGSDPVAVAGVTVRGGE